MASISMTDIVKDYGSVRAIHGIDLEIDDGEFVVFVGPSGCGKSTLLRMVAGLEDITAGEMMIGDRVVNNMEPRYRDVAMVFQDYALYPHMTVAQNIGFGLRMRRTPASETKARVDEAAKMLQIEPLLARRPSELSGGQRQRVAMGRAIVRRPEVFLFDEPLSNLDAKLRVEMRTEIKRLHGLLGRTTVYVTHDQVEALTLADRVVILKEGRILQEGPPISLYNHPGSRFVAEFIGSPQMNMLSGKVEQSDIPTLRVGEVSLPFAHINAPNGTEIDLGIRPENFSLAAGGKVDLTAIVEVSEPLGSDTMVTCHSDQSTLTVRLPPDVPITPGASLPLVLDRAKLHLFSTETGDRIEAQIA